MSLTFHFLNAKFFFCLLITLTFQHPLFTFASSNTIKGLTLRADVDVSPGSPLYLIENLTISERIEKLINVTKARVNYLDLVSGPNTRLVPNSIRMPVLREGLIYTIGVGIGSQRQPLKLLMDTGGGLIWTQCKPCLNCFPQKVPIYDPRDSHSYGFLPCGHRLCNGDHRLYRCNSDKKCVYDVGYGDGASTRGVASFEAFQFHVSETQTKSYNNVIFGCSNDSSNIDFQNTDISGIFGLNLSPDSMLKQFAPLIQSRFSYCFVPFDNAMPRPLDLLFGEDVPHTHNVQTTRFIVPLRNYFYYLELLDISIANHRMGFLPHTFNTRSVSTGGCIIDSGALITEIDTQTPGVNAYETVKQAFEAYYNSRGLRKRPSTQRGLEICYCTPKNYNDFASITFHFNGADYVVDGVLGHVIQNDHFCVAIMPGQMTALGAWHQQNKRLIYDVGLGVLQFTNEQC